VSRPRLTAERARALAEALRAARQARDLTQEQLAEAGGLSVVHLQRLEAALGNPTLATMYALAEALDVPVTALLPA
jgi:transcriptional regulator with XRE-family HTH domain